MHVFLLCNSVNISAVTWQSRSFKLMTCSAASMQWGGGGFNIRQSCRQFASQSSMPFALSTSSSPQPTTHQSCKSACAPQHMPCAVCFKACAVFVKPCRQHRACVEGLMSGRAAASLDSQSSMPLALNRPLSPQAAPKLQTSRITSAYGFCKPCEAFYNGQ